MAKKPKSKSAQYYLDLGHKYLEKRDISWSQAKQDYYQQKAQDAFAKAHQVGKLENPNSGLISKLKKGIRGTIKIIGNGRNKRLVVKT